MKLDILLWDIESSMNLGLIIRTCYMVGNGLIHLNIFDPKSRMKADENNIRRFSSYALEYYDSIKIFTDFNDIDLFIKSHHGRIISTCVSEDSSIELREITFENGDLIIFGNEFVGIPDNIMNLSDIQMVIPMYGRIYPRPNPDGKLRNIDMSRSYGINTSVSITLFQAVDQISQFRHWRKSKDSPINFK